jgi:hypothetical protein
MKSISVLNKQDNLSSFYRSEGYVAVCDVFPTESLKKLQIDMKLLLSLSPWNVKNEDFDKNIIELNSTNPQLLHSFQVAATQLWSFYSLMSYLNSVVTCIVGEQKVYFHVGQGFVLGLPSSKRLAYDWHQDGTYHSDRETIHVWFPVFRNASQINGAMSFLERSHSKGILEFEKTKFDAGGYTTNKISGIEELLLNHEELICELDLGGCLFFSDEMMHKSNVNQTDLCRVAGVAKISLDPVFETHAGLVGV